MGILIILLVLGIGLICWGIRNKIAYDNKEATSKRRIMYGGYSSILSDDDYGAGCVAPFAVGVMVSFAFIVVSIVVICIQASAPAEIYRLEQKREALVESYNIYFSNYDDDLAHSQTLKDARLGIAEFNAEINTNNHFVQNFFTNWFYIDCRTIEPIQIVDGLAR